MEPESEAWVVVTPAGEVAVSARGEIEMLVAAVNDAAAGVAEAVAFLEAAGAGESVMALVELVRETGERVTLRRLDLPGTSGRCQRPGLPSAPAREPAS